MKGSYILLIQLKRRQHITIGSLDAVECMPGYYAYVGSALHNLEKRIRRHLSPKKKMFWHIDYLLEHAEVLDVYRIENPRKLECRIAERLSRCLASVHGFGCSDCRCKSHLFYARDRCRMETSIRETIDTILSIP